jgi:triacylglycerol esterase/lipase EstA (alpha/beta hydrolase family)
MLRVKPSAHRRPIAKGRKEHGMGSRAFTVTVSAVLTLVIATATAQAAGLPVIYNGLLGYAHVSATADPPGANRWGCKPSPGHPRPVILVHGTFGDKSDSWQALSPLLYDQGYCVFALNYGSNAGSGSLGIYGTGEIVHSAAQLSRFVNRVLGATHASRVDLVGHSQGGMMPRYYINFLGGAAKVSALVGLAPSSHGTTLAGLSNLVTGFPGAATFRFLCPACGEQLRGSAFLSKLNARPDTAPGVHYTVIASRYDEVVTPFTSSFLSGPNVTNIVLQKQCSRDAGEHLSMPYDHIADGDVLNALDPAHPRSPKCTRVLPVVGG